MMDNLGTDPAYWTREFLMKLDARGNTPRGEIALRYFTYAMEAARAAERTAAAVKKE
jgi:hypothetical protein